MIYQDPKDKDEGAAGFCRENDWSYRHYRNMAGCEDEAVIVMDCLATEPISRPHNLLVLVTTPHARYIDCQNSSCIIKSELGIAATMKDRLLG